MTPGEGPEPHIGLDMGDCALGAALSNESAAAILCDTCELADFYTDSQRRVFRTILMLHRAGSATDERIVADALPAHRDYILGLPGACPAAVNVRTYIERLKEHRWHRDLKATAQKLVEISGNGAQSDALAAWHQEAGQLFAGPAGRSSQPLGADPIGGRIDWPTFWSREHEESEWLVEDVLARGRGHVIYALHKFGKSLFMLYLSAQLATGPEPVQVVYIDYEMSWEDVRDRLADMGFDRGTDFSRFHYHLLPTLPPLDTADGATALMAGLDAYRAERPDHDLVLTIDTMSRAVSGPENDSDTVRAFFNRTGIELKRREVTWVRLDHAGKDPTKGQRGTSGKGDDVDLVWELSKTNQGIRLRREASRMVWVPQSVAFTMSDDFPLAYKRAGGDYPDRTGEVANMLDRFGVALDASYRAAGEALRQHEERCSNEVIRAAILFRKDRSK
jgi:hypothetical protein